MTRIRERASARVSGPLADLAPGACMDTVPIPVWGRSLANSFPPGNCVLNFTNRESLPITHELVLISLPSGKSAQDVISAARATGPASEDKWLHFGEIPDVNSGATKAQTFDLPAGTYAFACW